MTLHQQFKTEMIEAMKAREVTRLGVLRGLLSQFTNELVASKRKPDEQLNDEEVLTVIRRAVKQRRDSIEQFEKGGRNDLADVEKSELLILEKYLPAQLSKEKIIEVAKAKMEQLDIKDKSKSGILMSAIMKDLKGQADGTAVKSVVEELLS